MATESTTPAGWAYEGRRTAQGCEVVVVLGADSLTAARKRLDPANRLFNHSPDGFEWGYGGSGPAQLALAILFDYLMRSGTPRKTAGPLAVHLHQDFKRDFIAPIPHSSFYLAAATVAAWIKTQQAEREAEGASE